jgi:hypothetical protein
MEIKHLCGKESIFKIIDKGICKQKKLFTKDLNLAAIQTLKDYQTVDILRDGLMKTVKGLKNIYTALFGSGILVKYPQAAIFIIGTVILTIMQLITWSVFKLLDICRIMVRMPVIALKNLERKYYGKTVRRQPNGMEVMREINGIKNTGKGRSNTKMKGNVKNVGRSTSLKSKDRISVQENVNTDTSQGKTERDTTHQKKQSVNIAARSLIHCQKMLADFAEGNVIKTHAKVYDLTMDGRPVYYANGILVHNCSDALEYLIMSAFENYIQLI